VSTRKPLTERDSFDNEDNPFAAIAAIVAIAD
jgi:hypothetical protein